MAIFKFYQIFRSIAEVLGEERAYELFSEYKTLPEKMQPDQQVQLARKIMERLDDSLDAETVAKIRHCHPCNVPKEYEEKIRELVKVYPNLDDRIKVYMEWLGIGSIQKNGSIIEVSWGLKTCACGMFTKLSSYEPVSKSWCECCNAHNEKYIGMLCGCPVKSELIEGIACGGKECVFKVSV